MMRLIEALLGVVPVTSQSVDRRPVREPVPVPEMGTRWGAPSEFSFSLAEAARGAAPSMQLVLPERGPPHFARIIPAVVTMQREVARVSDPDDADAWAELDRWRRMMFSYTEFPAKPRRGSLQPSFTTVYDLSFDLHPEGEVAT